MTLKESDAPVGGAQQESESQEEERMQFSCNGSLTQDSRSRQQNAVQTNLSRGTITVQQTNVQDAGQQVNGKDQ